MPLLPDGTVSIRCEADLLLGPIRLLLSEPVRRKVNDMRITNIELLFVRYVIIDVEGSKISETWIH